MLQPIEGFGPNVIALRAVGKVSADDYSSVLGPQIQRVIAEGHKVRLLLELGDDFDGYDMGAMFADAKLGAAELNSFEKLAVVTDNDLFRSMIETFGRFMPAAVKVFDPGDMDAARTWMSG